MRINVAVPEGHVSEPVLNATLEGVTRLDEQLVRSRQVPTFRAALPRVKWQNEPPGQEHFDHAGVVLGRGWGDCDDLAPWHAASLRATGQDPRARAIVMRSGPQRWHAVVRRGDGAIEDPSRAAGMRPVLGLPGISGGVLCPLDVGSVVGTYTDRPNLALRPVFDRAGQPEAWQARADLPWHWRAGDSPADVAMVSLHKSPVAAQSIAGALLGATRLARAARGVERDVLDRAGAVAMRFHGAPPRAVVERFGREHARAAEQLHHEILGHVGSLLENSSALAQGAQLFDKYHGVHVVDALGDAIDGKTGSGKELGAAIGGSAGAAIGSIIPGVGTVLGGLVGGFLGGIFGGLFGGQPTAAMTALQKTVDRAYLHTNAEVAQHFEAMGFDQGDREQWSELANKIAGTRRGEFPFYEATNGVHAHGSPRAHTTQHPEDVGQLVRGGQWWAGYWHQSAEWYAEHPTTFKKNFARDAGDIMRGVSAATYAIAHDADLREQYPNAAAVL